MSEAALHRLSRSRFAFPAERAQRIKGERCGWNNQRLRLELTSAWVSEDGKPERCTERCRGAAATASTAFKAGFDLQSRFGIPSEP